MKRIISTGFLALLSVTLAFAADPPEAQISNQLVRATVAIPDVQNGYYRGPRFDWSGVIPSLEYAGHVYFLQRTPRPDPTSQGSAPGPVEDFAGPGGAGLNYAEAKPGETFVKIGVGVLKKPDEPKYDFRTAYEFVDNGKWTVRKGPDWVETTQELTDPKSGYAYIYRKTVRLATDKPQLILEHYLKNTGQKVIETSVLDHNFLVIDRQPTGPGFTATFPYEVKGDRDLRGLAEIRGNQIVYLKPVGDGQQAATNVTGYRADARDYDIRVENHNTGAGVHIQGNRPLSRLFFWSVPTTVCPEAYIDINIQPGADFSWAMTYDFYVLAQESGVKPAAR